MFSLVLDKAPGLDGFTMAVFQECWKTVKDDLVDLSRECHLSGKISRGLNATFITFIPKRVVANCILSVSLISAPYRIIAKVLSNRVREVLHEIIDGNNWHSSKEGKF